MRNFTEHRAGRIWGMSWAVLSSLSLAAWGQTPTRAADDVRNYQQSAVALEENVTAPRPDDGTLKGARVVVSFERLNEEMGRAADVQFGRAAEADARAAPGAPRSQIDPGSAATSETPDSSTHPGPLGTIEKQLGMLGVNARRIFGEAGVPMELLAVASVESRLNPRAASPKGALGIWQFMPATARQYGLRVEPMIDDRLNPKLETQAAVRYLRDLHFRFGDWPLALAAYNAGEYRVETAINQAGSANYWTLRQQHRLPEETRKYVPAIFGLLDGNSIGAVAGNQRLIHEPLKGIQLFATSDNGK